MQSFKYSFFIDTWAHTNLLVCKHLTSSSWAKEFRCKVQSRTRKTFKSHKQDISKFRAPISQSPLHPVAASHRCFSQAACERQPEAKSRPLYPWVNLQARILGATNMSGSHEKREKAWEKPPESCQHIYIYMCIYILWFLLNSFLDLTRR